MENLINDNLHLSDDHEENMRMKNELLKLKLNAELGAKTYFSGHFPPELEYEFLKNVLEFEKSFSNASMKNIFEQLDKPVFSPADELDDQAIELALEGLFALMKKKQIALAFSGTYDSRTKYKFITEEFFDEEITGPIIPGMTRYFCYEEFHPNHKLDIESKTISFISTWINHKVTEDCWELADTFILPNGQTLNKDEIANKIKNICNGYSEFKNCRYNIDKIDFQLQNDTGMGFAEGTVKYTAVLRNHEEIDFLGPFKFYFTLEFEWWSIFYFIFPGFELPIME